MRLHDLRVSSLRNLSDLHLAPCPGLNIVTGPNASGKTALLEAVYLMARGRSFRTSRALELIQHQKPRLQVTATLVDDRGRSIPVGVERDQNQIRIRYDGASVRSLSAYVHHFPVVLITPDSHSLMSGRPGLRRHWLDWGLFHVEPAYLEDWRKCFHALRQRNALLKRRAPGSQFSPWERALSQAADRIDSVRHEFCTRLSATLAEVLAEILPGTPGIDYQRGWDAGVVYQDLLRERRRPDCDRGFTAQGPHRADLEFRHNGMPVRSTLSRGQSKLYVAGLMLALARLFADRGPQPVILVDDLPAELDADARQRFLTGLVETGGQIFVTAIEPGQIDINIRGPAAVFHVEHGQLVEMVQ